MTPPDYPALRDDYRLLDSVSESDFIGGLVVMHEDFPAVQTVRLDPPAEGAGFLSHLRFALRLLRAGGPGRALLLNQVDRFASLACLLNRLLPSRLRRRIVLYDVFVDTPSAWKAWLVRRMVEGATVNVLFSRAQVDHYARVFRLPRARFAFVPYQASHSKRLPVVMPGPEFRFVSEGRELSVPVDGFVFSGGNSARDYRTLCEAVRGTGIPVVVTSTEPALFAGVDVPPEITRVSVREPDFTRLMAASRFCVMPLTAGRIRGYGEQTILNSGWHGRTIVAADDVSAADYLEDGVTGFVTAPGDAAALRERLRRLWDDPSLSRRMGEALQRRVQGHFSHDHFVARMKRLTLALAAWKPEG